MEFTEKQMEKLVEDVRNQLSALLKGETESTVLAKSETVEEVEPPKVEEQPLEKAETKEESEESSSLEKSGLPPDAKKAEESESDSPEKTYKEMSKSEREEHYKALKRFIWEDQGFEIKKACKEEVVEESTEESTKEDAEKAEDSADEKSEEEKTDDKACKSELDFNALKAENVTLKKNVEQLIAGLNKVIVQAPDRKSVSSLNEIVPKPGEGSDESLTEPALRERLNTLTKSEKLTPSERGVINNYVVNHSGREQVLSIVKDKK